MSILCIARSSGELGHITELEYVKIKDKKVNAYKDAAAVVLLGS